VKVDRQREPVAGLGRVGLGVLPLSGGSEIIRRFPVGLPVSAAARRRILG